jgi:hypothetical protein
MEKIGYKIGLTHIINQCRRGVPQWTSASGTEDPGSNPDRVYDFWGKHSNTVVFN